MEQRELINEISDIITTIVTGESAITPDAKDNYLVSARRALIVLAVKLEKDVIKQSISGTDVYLETYGTDVEAEIDDVWKHMTINALRHKRNERRIENIEALLAEQGLAIRDEL